MTENEKLWGQLNEAVLRGDAPASYPEIPSDVERVAAGALVECRIPVGEDLCDVRENMEGDGVYVNLPSGDKYVVGDGVLLYTVQ